MKSHLPLALLATLAWIPASTVASPGRHGPPPQEAIDACLDLAAEDACAFVHRNEDREGVCKPGPEPDLPLACRPDHGEERRRR